jgi:hypothetical protein
MYVPPMSRWRPLARKMRRYFCNPHVLKLLLWALQFAVTVMKLFDRHS